MIKNDKNYTKGEPIKLFSCNTGSPSTHGPDFAQNLANALGVPVTAPDNFGFAFDNGDYEIGPQSAKDPNKRDKKQPPGHWMTYLPSK